MFEREAAMHSLFVSPRKRAEDGKSNKINLHHRYWQQLIKNGKKKHVNNCLIRFNGIALYCPKVEKERKNPKKRKIFVTKYFL